MKITIPNPCHENWGAMTKTEQGRFCGSCQKTVVDFTTFTNQDIQNYFTKNYGQKICGNFKNEQLAHIHIQIPNTVFSYIPASRKFALALFIVFRTTLFSCTDNNGKNATIGKIEVVDSLTKNIAETLESSKPIEQELLGEAEYPKHRKLKGSTVIIKHAKQISKGKTKTDKNELIGYNINRLEGSVRGITFVNYEVDSNEILIDAEERPKFIEGEEALKAFINKNIIYPPYAKENRIEGRVVVRFVIERDSTISNIEILQKLGFGCDEEVIRLVKTMPNWIPGKSNGKPVRVYYTLPIVFKL